MAGGDFHGDIGLPFHRPIKQVKGEMPFVGGGFASTDGSRSVVNIAHQGEGMDGIAHGGIQAD